jgi:hypothetical protein
MGLAGFDGHPSSGLVPEGCPTMESMGKKPRRRRSFTPEFKAEIVETAVMTPRNNTAPPYAVTA